MPTTTTLTTLFCLALVGGMFQRENSCVTNAFSLNSRSGPACRNLVSIQPEALGISARTTRSGLYMAEGEEAASEAGEEDSDEAESAEEEDEGPPEDPEVTALKESIAELEATLADKKSKLQYELEKCEEYSKSGYARKVADMENMKRVRSVSMQWHKKSNEMG